MKIQDRTFLVSGGSSGLGLAAVHELIRSGAYVSILDIHQPNDNLSSRVRYIKADVTKVDEIERAIEETVKWTMETGASLGGVIHGAGVATPELIVDRNGAPHSTTNWDRTMAINVSGTFHLTRLASRHLIDVKPEEGPDSERGVIIMISSTVAYEGSRGQMAYAASKGAIRSMTQPLSRDFSRYGVRVVSVAPSLFETPLTSRYSAKGPEGAGLLHPRRFGAPEEFAMTVKWILENPYVNGVTVKLTGGSRNALL